MLIKRKILSALIFCIALPVIFGGSRLIAQMPAAEIDPLKKQEILRMLEVTGVVKMMEQMVDQVVNNAKGANNSSIPAEFWTKFKNRANLQGLVDEIVPIYNKHYTLADLQAMNEFYASAVGQRLLASMPQVMSESMTIGQNWGRRISEQVMQEINSAGSTGGNSKRVSQ